MTGAPPSHLCKECDPTTSTASFPQCRICRMRVISAHGSQSAQPVEPEARARPSQPSGRGMQKGAHYWDEYCQQPQRRSTRETESLGWTTRAEDLGRVGQ